MAGTSKFQTKLQELVGFIGSIGVGRVQNDGKSKKNESSHKDME